jgi:hypothetical protein
MVPAAIRLSLAWTTGRGTEDVEAWNPLIATTSEAASTANTEARPASVIARSFFEDETTGGRIVAVEYTAMPRAD